MSLCGWKNDWASRVGERALPRPGQCSQAESTLLQGSPGGARCSAHHACLDGGPLAPEHLGRCPQGRQHGLGGDQLATGSVATPSQLLAHVSVTVLMSWSVQAHLNWGRTMPTSATTATPSAARVASKVARIMRLAVQGGHVQPLPDRSTLGLFRSRWTMPLQCAHEGAVKHARGAARQSGCSTCCAGSSPPARCPEPLSSPGGPRPASGGAAEGRCTDRRLHAQGTQGIFVWQLPPPGCCTCTLPLISSVTMKR